MAVFEAPDDESMTAFALSDAARQRQDADAARLLGKEMTTSGKTLSPPGPQSSRGSYRGPWVPARGLLASGMTAAHGRCALSPAGEGYVFALQNLQASAAIRIPVAQLIAGPTAHLLLAAPAPALRRWGNAAHRRCARARGPTIAATGTGAAELRALHIIAPISGPRRQPVVAGRHLQMAGYVYDLAS